MQPPLNQGCPGSREVFINHKLFKNRMINGV
jgi:hypothetical protein